MSYRLIVLLVLLAAASFLTACEEQSLAGPRTALEDAKLAGWAQYGPSQRLAGIELDFSDVTAVAEDVIVTGTIGEVCQTKGCWMTVKDGDSEMLVRFKNYSFFMPMNAAGHRCAIHGNIEAMPVSVEALRMQAEAAGATPEEIAAIIEPGERLFIMADAVYIEGEGLDAPYKPGDEIDLEGHEHADHDAEVGEGGAMIEGGGCPGEDEGEGCGNCPDAAANVNATVEDAAQPAETEACAGEHTAAEYGSETAEEACGERSNDGCGGCGGCGGEKQTTEKEGG